MNPIIRNIDQAIEHNATHEMQEPCTICERRNMGQLQLSGGSRAVHLPCYEIVEEAERDLLAKIQELFPSKDDLARRHIAHVAAIHAVRRACGNDSIRDFAQQYGKEALKRLFDSQGVEAVRKYHNGAKL